MGKFIGASKGIAIVVLLLAVFSVAYAADQRRVQYSTVACMSYGALVNNFSGSAPKGSRIVDGCISLEKGDVVVVEREQGAYAQVRPGGKVDRYWMPLDPVRWTKP